MILKMGGACLKIIFPASLPISRLIVLLLFATGQALSSRKILNCENEAQQPPQISIVLNSTPALDETDNPTDFILHVENHQSTPWSNLTFKDCTVHVEFLCKANYPVEWVEINDHDIEELTDTDGSIHKNMWTDRVINETLASSYNSSDHLTSITDPSVTSYNAFLGITQKQFCFAANYSCRSVSNPCLQSSVVSIVDKENKTIRYTEANSSLALSKDDGNSSSCDVIITVAFGHKYAGWKCTDLNDNPKDLIPFSKNCDAAMQCNSYFKHFKQDCVKRLPPTEECYGCRYKNVSKGFHAGFVWCENGKGKIFTALPFFYSVPQTMNPKAIPELYLNWEEAEPEKMLFIEPLEKHVYYVGENITVFCRVSRFYFSFGHRFGFEHENGTVWYTSSRDGQHYSYFNVNRMGVTIPVESGLKRVYCIAPVWNSTAWVNQSHEVTTKNGGMPPKVYINDGDKDLADVTFPLHKKNATLSCHGFGVPEPNITWSKEGFENIQGSQVIDDSVGQILAFHYVTYSVRGVYKCEARNSFGVVSKMVKVDVRDEFALLIQLSGIIAFVIISAFAVTLCFCWRKIRRQKKQLRALTDAEIKEFREGNLEVLESTEFLDTQELLQALPYNDTFEISCEQLHIDTTTVLGTGNFGLVMKGCISYRKGSVKHTTEVAVKTVKPNHDVTYFKTLLSEVKIMAYIGHHANVLSLLGACTASIRKREIFIAVEFCEKGSLDKFLKKCRTSFINLVSDDTIYITLGLAEAGHSYENLKQPDVTRLYRDCYITTLHLLKWSREISNGMEFLGSKKIIHGDLASRNILLTHDLVAKIGDFGLSRQLVEYKNYVRSTDEDCVLPWRWMAYETLEDMKFSVQSDVWSYGVTLWEIFTLGNIPYPGLNWNCRFLEELKDGIRLHKPTYANSQIYNIMLECWSLDGMNRPNFTELKDFFEGLLLQTTSDEYLETRKNYMNGSHDTTVRHNPGYSILGNVNDYPTNRDSTNDIKYTMMRLLNDNGKVRTKEDSQGYLRPLMIEMEEQD